DIVSDASGSVFVAWCEFGGGAQGVLVRRIDPASASPVGSQVQLPGSTTSAGGVTQASCVLESEVSRREPMVARAGGGVFGVGTVNLSAQSGRVDVLAIIQGSSGSSLQHTQLLPGLSLLRTGLVRRRGGTAAVTFKVLDAGDSVAGARVHAGGRTAATGANGTATLVLRRGGVATAAKAGYVGASVRFGCCR